MRRLKRDRGKPIPKSDLDQIAIFRAEMKVYGDVRAQGKTHEQAMAIVWAEELPPKPPVKICPCCGRELAEGEGDFCCW